MIGIQINLLIYIYCVCFRYPSNITRTCCSSEWM